MVVRQRTANVFQNILSAIANVIRECLAETVTKKRTFLRDASVPLIVAPRNVFVLRMGPSVMNCCVAMGKIVFARM